MERGAAGDRLAAGPVFLGALLLGVILVGALAVEIDSAGAVNAVLLAIGRDTDLDILSAIGAVDPNTLLGVLARILPARDKGVGAGRDRVAGRFLIEVNRDAWRVRCVVEATSDEVVQLGLVAGAVGAEIALLDFREQLAGAAGAFRTCRAGAGAWQQRRV